MRAIELGPDAEGELFRLRYEWTQLSLLQGFDELLCLPTLHGVETYWYQVEAVRKVLKQFHGRVLLADEVGLGKTVEAGMVLKEYLLRGMVERVLILTPATLVGQWQEEMATKFDVRCATSYDALLRQAPLAFWAQPRVIASIATARRPEHRTLLAQQQYDLVIVDEAHHLKNRATANWQLVDVLQKRFLLPSRPRPSKTRWWVYNLLTLLKPGIFKTEKEFRASYMMSGKPRLPANRERMRDLMRDVMIRNTRSLVDTYHRATPRPCAWSLALKSCLLSGTDAAGTAGAPAKLGGSVWRYTCSPPGSHATTAAAPSNAIRRRTACARTGVGCKRVTQPSADEKSVRSATCSAQPHERKIVFVHHRETLARLAQLMGKEASRMSFLKAA